VVKFAQFCEYTKNSEWHVTLKRDGDPAPVAHTYNPSYLGGRDQENRGLKPAPGNSSQDPISKMPNTSRFLSCVDYRPNTNVPILWKIGHAKGRPLFIQEWI
jgi:hypothetical protein